MPDMKVQDMKMQDMNLQYMTNIVWKYVTLQCSVHFLNFKSCMYMYGECVNVENLTSPAHHKYSSIL